MQQMVQQIPLNDPDLPQYQYQLGNAFAQRYQNTRDLNDLNAAIDKLQEAVDLRPEDHPGRAEQLQDLATCFTDRFRQLGDLKDLEAALQRDQEAVDLTPADHPDKAERLQSLAVSFSDRFQRLGDLKDLEAALEKKQEAMDLTPADHPRTTGRLQSLAVSLRDRFLRLGNLKDLDAAIQKLQNAVDLTPVDQPDKTGQLQNLATSLIDRFRHLGHLEDLETALQRAREAVDLTPADHPDRAERVQCLATSFGHRFQRLGDFKDLQAAIQNFQDAVDLTPVDHPDRAGRLQCLAVSFKDRFERMGDPKDLDTALQKDQEAVNLTPADHPDRAGRLKGLAGSFRYRFERMGDPKDLDTALQKDQEAVNLTPADHPDRAGRLQSLAESFTDRFKEFGNLKDLEAALQSDREALDLTPEDHPDRAERLLSLAISLTDLYKQFREPSVLTAVHTCFGQSFKTNASSDPEPLWHGALGWASFSEEFQPEHCSTAYSAAFSLLPDILWIGLTIPTRHDTIRRLDIGGTASAATRTCIKLADLTFAVQLIEQGLATIFQQMLQLKPDFDSLQPDQAEDLQQLSLVLYSGTAADPSGLACKRKELLKNIRQQPGFEYYLLPKPYKALCHASQGGPVVILNCDRNGCDGLIILNPTSEPVHVALPNATFDLLKSQQMLLKKLLNRCNVRVRQESASTRLFGHQEMSSSKTIEECFTDLLTWLWNNVVDPVYQVLAAHGLHSGRLWWLPTGSFTGLPLHACPPTNQFIHSYTATLASLLEGQAKPVTTSHKIGVVGVTHTGLGGVNHLRGVGQEVEKICSIIKSPNLECVLGKQATPDAVKHQLQNCSWVHLACHGTQDLVEPIKSRLLLYNGVLELETILQMPLSNAEVVFLTACQTAMGDAELANESFHLGGGFIAAGFRGAIGTLWSMDDRDGPLVAETVYSHLFKNGREPQATDAAEALHLAVNKLKAEKVPYQRWVPFIHMGV
ncbi:CHAT domain-containing protein [Mycena metata]|uniref:CHAT domain-containing protein n=1 Tax=Mycena metata TaxID=1033252 RepID=A0AAD7NMR4_9AGAR|nr:CHAT domain-containing protein [Mycena metata]